MSQYFSKNANTLARFSILGAVSAVGIVMWLGYMVVRSPYETMQNVPREQPVAFSHEHHVGGLGIDCRYCHTSVEYSAYANIPPTKTCMNCHSQLWSVSPELAPVRESWRSGRSIAWTSIHDLPDYVYFNHSIHVNKGVGCSTCHGRVDKMPLMWQAQPLTMGWCLDCHRQPEKYLRPKDKVYAIGYRTPPNQLQLGTRLLAEYHVKKLISCSTCHR